MCYLWPRTCFWTLPKHTIFFLSSNHSSFFWNWMSSNEAPWSLRRYRIGSASPAPSNLLEIKHNFQFSRSFEVKKTNPEQSSLILRNNLTHSLIWAGNSVRGEERRDFHHFRPLTQKRDFFNFGQMSFSFDSEVIWLFFFQTYLLIILTLKHDSNGKRTILLLAINISFGLCT